MQSIRLIRYFFYLLTNWNLNVAFHILKKEIRGEKKYGIFSTGSDDLDKLRDKGIDLSHATIYMPASYDILEDIFTHLKQNTIHHLLDIGCGKGRVLCVAAYHGVKKLTGIDLSKEFCTDSVRNLEKIKQTLPDVEYVVKNTDAFYFDIPDDADYIFFFNPFDEIIMSGVIKNIKNSIGINPRKITIIYLNPIHKNLFLNTGFVQTYSVKKLKYLEGCIMVKE